MLAKKEQSSTISTIFIRSSGEKHTLNSTQHTQKESEEKEAKTQTQKQNKHKQDKRPN